MQQPRTLAEHIAEFTGKIAKFREKKFVKLLRRNRRKTAKRKPDDNKRPAID